MLARLRVGVVFAVVLGLAGCAPKLDEKGTKTLEGLDYTLLKLPKVSQVQKVTIDVESAEPVNVLVMDTSAENGFENLAPDKQEALAKYGKKMKVTKDSLSVEVPANTAVLVGIGGSHKKTEVKYSISNRK